MVNGFVALFTLINKFSIKRLLIQPKYITFVSKLQPTFSTTIKFDSKLSRLVRLDYLITLKNKKYGCWQDAPTFTIFYN